MAGVIPNDELLASNLEIADNLSLIHQDTIDMCWDVYLESALQTTHIDMIEGRFVADQLITRVARIIPTENS